MSLVVHQLSGLFLSIFLPFYNSRMYVHVHPIVYLGYTVLYSLSLSLYKLLSLKRESTQQKMIHEYFYRKRTTTKSKKPSHIYMLRSNPLGSIIIPIVSLMVVYILLGPTVVLYRMVNKKKGACSLYIHRRCVEQFLLGGKNWWQNKIRFFFLCFFSSLRWPIGCCTSRMMSYLSGLFFYAIERGGIYFRNSFSWQSKRPSPSFLFFLCAECTGDNEMLYYCTPIQEIKKKIGDGLLIAKVRPINVNWLTF